MNKFRVTKKNLHENCVKPQHGAHNKKPTKIVCTNLLCCDMKNENTYKSNKSCFSAEWLVYNSGSEYCVNSCMGQHSYVCANHKWMCVCVRLNNSNTNICICVSPHMYPDYEKNCFKDWFHTQNIHFDRKSHLSRHLVYCHRQWTKRIKESSYQISATGFCSRLFATFLLKNVGWLNTMTVFIYGNGYSI